MFTLYNIDLEYKEQVENIVVGHGEKDVSYTYVPHLHRHYEIYYNVNGAKGFMINGEFYKCKERDLIVIPRFFTHKALVNKGVKYERCIINIDQYTVDMIAKIVGSQDELMWLTNDNSEKPKMVNLSREQSDYYVSLIKEYIAIKHSGDYLQAFSVFLSLLVFLKKVFGSNKKTEYLDEEHISYVDNVLNFIEHNFKNITVSDIAKKYNIDGDYLNRLFKAETGTSIKRYIIIRRLTEAKKYICLGKPVKEACYMAGFKDYANFARLFKKYEGYPPSKITKYSIE